jgi:CheY-like chemotaxis protein
MRTQVLLMDDVSAIRALLRDILQEEGYPVVQALNGAAALTVLRTSMERMVVLLSTRNGLAVMEAALQEPAVDRHAFVLVTALADDLPLPWRQLVDILGVAVVPKPFALTTLLETVAHAAMSPALV